MIRLATSADAAQVAAIYAPFCRDSAVSFEEQPPSVGEMSERIAATLQRLPWLVADDGHSGIAGYAYASRHRDRPAYRWSVEVSCYVRADRYRQGVGRALYVALFDVLVALGHHNACAGVALPNPASVAMHESLGFTPVGAYRQIGFKRGAWHDVGWWQKSLQFHVDNPKPPRPLPEALDAVNELLLRQKG